MLVDASPVTRMRRAWLVVSASMVKLQGVEAVLPLSVPSTAPISATLPESRRMPTRRLAQYDFEDAVLLAMIRMSATRAELVPIASRLPDCPPKNNSTFAVASVVVPVHHTDLNCRVANWSRVLVETNAPMAVENCVVTLACSPITIERSFVTEAWEPIAIPPAVLLDARSPTTVEPDPLAFDAAPIATVLVLDEVDRLPMAMESANEATCVAAVLLAWILIAPVPTAVVVGEAPRITDPPLVML